MGSRNQLRAQGNCSSLMRPSHIAILANAALLVGCKDEIADQEARVAIVDQSKDGAASCTEHQKLAQLQLQAKDEKKYNLEKAIADQICLNVHMEDALRRK